MTHEAAHLKECAFKNLKQLTMERDYFENAKATLMTALQLVEETKANVDTELEKKESEVSKHKGRSQEVTAKQTELKKVVVEQKVLVGKLENREKLSKSQLGKKASEIEHLTWLLRGLHRQMHE